MKADLHVHSNHSDGSYNPEEVIKIAKKAGLSCIALTDHNVVTGIPEAMKAGKKQGLEVIPGVEILSDCSEILAYYIDFRNKKLCDYLKKVQKGVDKTARVLITKLKKAGYKLDYNKIKRIYGYPIMRIHVLFYLRDIEKKDPEKKLQELRKQAYYPGGKFYFKIKQERAEKVVKIIRKAHGIPVLAHPWFEKGFEKRVPSLVRAGLLGIEINSPGKNKRDINKINKLCKRYNLIKTGGNDFHSHSINPFMKKYYCDYKVVEEMKKIKKKFNR